MNLFKLFSFFFGKKRAKALHKSRGEFSTGMTLAEDFFEEKSETLQEDSWGAFHLHELGSVF
jgi:hypothetical protein